MTSRKVSNHTQQRAQGSRHTKQTTACARESPETSHLRLHAESKQLPTTRTRQSAQRATHSRPKPDRCPTRKTSSAAQTFHNAFMHLQSYRLQQTQHLQHCVAHSMYTCNASRAITRGLKKSSMPKEMTVSLTCVTTATASSLALNT